MNNKYKTTAAEEQLLDSFYKMVNEGGGDFKINKNSSSNPANWTIQILNCGEVVKEGLSFWENVDKKNTQKKGS